jgi:DMSO/TMAO reductase YedYZ heme-binding membrane subunit
MTSNEATKHVLLKICMFPMFLMLISEITRLANTISQAKMGNSHWKFIHFYGFLFVLLFFTYTIPELCGVFTTEAENER